MERITKAMVHRKISQMQLRGFDIGTDNAYGKMSICNISQSENYSGLRTPAVLFDVIKGFEKGVNCERQRLWHDHPVALTWVHQEAAKMEDCEVKRALYTFFKTLQEKE